MRTKKQIFMLLLALLVGIPTLSAQQSKKEKKEQKKEAVMKLIESENYKIDVNTAMPMRGRSIPLTSSYSLTIRNDSVISYLPYYGRAYSRMAEVTDLTSKPSSKNIMWKWIKKGMPLSSSSHVILKTDMNSEPKYFPMVRQVSMSICKTVSPLVFKENWI